MKTRVFDLRMTESDMAALDGAIDFYFEECAKREAAGDRSLSSRKPRLTMLKLRKRTEISREDWLQSNEEDHEVD